MVFESSLEPRVCSDDWAKARRSKQNINKQTNQQADNQTNRNKEANKQTQTSKQANNQTSKQTQQIHTHAIKQTHTKHTHIQTKNKH